MVTVLITIKILFHDFVVLHIYYFFAAFFENSDLLNNPIVGVMIGVLVTVLVQVKYSQVPPTLLCHSQVSRGT